MKKKEEAILSFDLNLDYKRSVKGANPGDFQRLRNSLFPLHSKLVPELFPERGAGGLHGLPLQTLALFPLGRQGLLLLLVEFLGQLLHAFFFRPIPLF